MQTKRIKLSQKYPIKLNAPTFKVPSPIENNMRITLSSTLAKPQKRMHMVGLIGLYGNFVFYFRKTEKALKLSRKFY